jgi:GTPase SAR1 family protein
MRLRWPPSKAKLNIAILGRVSAGKSTVLNALLQNKYSEIGKSRTTAGVNKFNILVRQSSSWLSSSLPTYFASSMGEPPSVSNRKILRAICAARARTTLVNA